VALLRAWRDCGETDPEAERLLGWRAADLFIDRHPAPEEVTPCEVVAIKIRQYISGARMEQALLAAERGPVDVRGEIERVLAQPEGELAELFPRGSESGEYLVLCALSDAAVVAGLEGRSDDALRLLDLTIRAGRLMEGRPWIFTQWCHPAARTVGRTLERTLSCLPEDADLEHVESYFTGLDPRGRLQTQLKGDRAFANRVFQLLREGKIYADEAGMSALDFLGLDLLVDLNQREYLEMMELILEECAKPRFDPTEKLDTLIRERLDGGWDCVTAEALIPRASGFHVFALEEEVIREFALAALLARREGTEAARARITSRIDPFSGEPYRTRVEPDGALVMWSVGTDGEDHDAQWDEEQESYSDIVWRFRPSR